MASARDLLLWLVLVAGSAFGTALLIVALKPLLARYALARPNARSSHTIPTPQGGGIAIVACVVIVIAACWVLGLAHFQRAWAAALVASLLVLAGMGAVDDIRPQPVLPRLGVQLVVAAALVLTLPAPAGVFGWLPAVIEIPLLVLGLVWFINLTNFMDGIDEITVAEMAPILLALAVFGTLELVPLLSQSLPVTLGLLGSLLGFAPFNRHVARLFLGDVGSLPIGALVGFLLLLLAAAGHLVAALILPLYYLADATVTLFRRWMRGERVSQAHRSHFYQVAVQRGFEVPGVTRRILALNVGLALLALWSVLAGSSVVDAVVLVSAALATAAVLRVFDRGRR